ncbi:putative HTH-type transcriptional regulator YybR [Lacunisphaera limnophila]|uniref:Putative HTH-type transcriptional regulator YybR n=2 Tax=Lacunisphaera limnophila TaxID=1838286 RepID=A0A1I7PI10_9BACT|nr:putative HTH-type transcriptional regulator YybR [Lacunisphaera limnophila]
MRFRYQQFCPLAKAAEVLGERWTILIVHELLLGTRRYRDFQRALTRLSPSLLTKRLNQLVDFGLVTRTTAPGQPHPEYELTAAGLELRPIVKGLSRWGMKWARGQMRDDELDVHLLMHDYTRRIDTKHLPAGRTILAFVFPGLPKYGHWWIVIDGPKERELCVHNPGGTPDLLFRTDVRTLTEIWAGDTELAAARKCGRLQLTGDPKLIRSLPRWFRHCSLAHIRPAAKPLRV